MSKRNLIDSVGNPLRRQLKAEDIPIIRQLKAEGVVKSEIARRFNVSRGTISQVVQGHTWKDVK